MNENILEAIKEYGRPYREKDDLDYILNQINHEKYVLLGESSHGTSEFYKIRAELTKKLIIEKGFTFIAVEGDWPACQHINRYIKGLDKENDHARDVLNAFNRWPTWMWANEEIVDLIEWLKKHNEELPKEKQVGFYGIDIYSLWESMDEIIKYLTKIDSPALETAKEAFSCFEPFNREHEKYAVSASVFAEGCRDEVIKLLTEISKNKCKDAEEGSLDLEVNALITKNAEEYYSTMILHDNESWNIRDLHMVEAINKIDEYYDNQAKGIIWEHNTHVGDARATDMFNEGMVNVGQILREQQGTENIYIVGFGTHRGSVVAASKWGRRFEKMMVPPAQSDSWEDLMHKAGTHDQLLVFNKGNKNVFSHEIGHRAIGVVYNPAYEQYGNYVPSVMAQRYNAFIFINHSNALTPLEVSHILV